MNIAIIISTHGKSSKEILKTTEMILGPQDNVITIDFLPNENTEILFKKYNDGISKLNINEGILFLVDIWGGSPFNAAIQFTKNKKKCEIVTGVNIPMLIEIFMAKEDNISLNELTNIAIKNGRIGIRSFKFSEFKEKHIESKKVNKIKNLNIKKNNHMNIGLARIDDRLIHGQIVTRWTKETNIKRIIVVSDEVAKDTIRKTLLTQVAPPGITAHVVDVNKAVRVYNNEKYANERVMLLFTNPTDVLRLVEKFVDIKTVNIGGMAFKQGKIQINNAVSVNKQDIKSFKKLHELGIKLEIRKVSSDTPINIIDLINKINY